MRQQPTTATSQSATSTAPILLTFIFVFAAIATFLVITLAAHRPDLARYVSAACATGAILSIGLPQVTQDHRRGQSAYPTISIMLAAGSIPLVFVLNALGAYWWKAVLYGVIDGTIVIAISIVMMAINRAKQARDLPADGESGSSVPTPSQPSAQAELSAITSLTTRGSSGYFASEYRVGHLARRLGTSPAAVHEINRIVDGYTVTFEEAGDYPLIIRDKNVAGVEYE